ncbi:MAG: succinate dehydrogenase cytochrome b subunit [Nitriliruptoraceae bacterium]
MATKVGATTPTRTPFLVELYRSALGKKYLMAITGVIWLGYVFAHMLGNLKLYQSADAFNTYAEFIRKLLYPILPEYGMLYLFRVVLIAALVVHVVAAYQLTVMNRHARPEAYRSKRDYIAADFAARTMRWTGVIVLLFLAYHVADITLTWVNPDPSGTVYERVVASFQQPAVAAFYLVANAALGFHLYHGAWSLFQSLGLNNRRFNHWRRAFAVGFTALVVVGNLSFPIAVQLGLVS